MRKLRLGNLRAAALALATCAAATTPVHQCYAQAPAAPAATRVTSMPPELDAYIEKARKDWNIPGIAIAIVKDDVVITRGYGVREQGKPGRVDENTIFNVASLTKSFTSAGAALLVGEGKLGWDTKARTLLPDLELYDPWVSSQVTLRDLLSHRTGTGSISSWAFTHDDRATAIRRLRFLEADIPFRTGLVYSNLLYAVAGEVTAKAAGMSWEALITDRLLRPLGMRNSSIGILDPGKGNIASAHTSFEGKGVAPLSWAWDLNTAPAGGMNSTAVDMARWMRFQLAEGELDGKRLISADALRETHEPQIVAPTTPAFRAMRGVEFFAGYGMGWQVMDYHGHAAVWHSGSAAGMPVYMTLMPKDKLGILVMLSSNEPGALHGSLAARIADAFLGLPTRDYSAELRPGYEAGLKSQREALARLDASRVPNTKPTLAPGAYPGTYTSPTVGDVILSPSAGGMTLQLGAKGEIADLTHWHYDTWLVSWRNPFLKKYYTTSVTFSIDAQPSAGSLSMRLGRELIKGERKPAAR